MIKIGLNFKTLLVVVLASNEKTLRFLNQFFQSKTALSRASLEKCLR